MKQKITTSIRGDAKLTVTLIVILLFLVAGYFAYKIFIPQLLNVLPSESENSIVKQTSELPVITDPKTGSKIVSPQVVRGTVPPGWMFEGIFPVKLLDSNRKVIIQTSATEEVPGAWQSNTPVYFKVTLTFTTSAKSGFLVLENDNPSGLPANLKAFEVPVSF